MNYNAIIKNNEIKKDYTYKGIVMLTLEILYPEIKLNNAPEIQNRMNYKYRREVNKFHSYATNSLFGEAVTEYQDSLKHDFPFRPFDAVMNYTATMNEHCTLSTFFDQYVFTGGAHGNTIRYSDNSNIQNGHRIELRNLFQSGEDYTKIILTQILKLADEQFRENPFIYFENYRSLIVKYFDKDSFYFNPDNLSVYYQQYQIGPYASGIIVFDIPYQNMGISRPSCDIKK